MRTYTEHFPHIGLPFTLCIGKFDGVHIGHRLILDTLLQEAARHSALSVVYSFEPRNGTPLLTTREERLNQFGQLGISAVVLAELSGFLMAMDAEDFIARIATCGSLRAVVVGEGFRFGKGAAGDGALLRELGLRHSFEVHEIPQVRLDGQPVSSTLIRECIKSGDVERAAAMLGREYALSGEVVAGRQLARQLGFRSANLLPPAGKVIPMNGVYACYVDVESKAWPAMVNVGVKPTINGSELLIESHLIGYEGDLYNRRITVRLVKKIRDEIRFESIGLLAEQLDRDRAVALKVLQP